MTFHILIFKVNEDMYLYFLIFMHELINMIDDAFFNQNWAGTCWGRWAGLGLPLGLLLALDATLPCKNKRQRGSAGASPVATSMPKSVSF